MKIFMKAVLAVVCLMASTGIAQATVILDTTHTWSADGSEADQTGRLSRNGIQSTWTAVKPNPGLFSSSLQDYVLFALNSGIFDQIQVTVEQLTDHNVYSAAYSSFNPADPAQNYLADAGLSSGVPPSPYFYQFILAPGTSFAVTLSTTNGVGSAAGGMTRLLVEGFSSTAVPEPATMAMLGSGVLVLGAIARKRRSAAGRT